MMSMQEDAQSRKISSEIMKRCLYKSAVAAPCRRRIANRTSCNLTARDGAFYSRKMLSLPITPMESQRATPSHSPTEERRFFYGFLSHGPTPRSTSPVPFDDEETENAGNEDDDENGHCKGLASLFRPRPRCVMARVWSQQDCDDALGARGGESRLVESRNRSAKCKQVSPTQFNY